MGGLSFLEIVYVGQCEVFVCLEFVEIFFCFFPLGRKLISPQTRCQFFKNVNFFFDTPPLNSMSYLRGGLLFLEIVFVGQCEVFVCLEFVEIFFFSPWHIHMSPMCILVLTLKQ